MRLPQSIPGRPGWGTEAPGGSFLSRKTLEAADTCEFLAALGNNWQDRPRASARFLAFGLQNNTIEVGSVCTTGLLRGN